MITIAIATMSASLENTIKKTFDLLSKSRRYRFLIISQGEECDLVEIKSDVLTIIKSTTIGLSKSRNIAIENVNSGWIWFQDDDIQLNIDNIDILHDIILEKKSDIYFVKIGSLEQKDALYKSYSHYKKHSRFNFLKISSIEIIVNAEFVKENQIKFDENLGLGTQLPCCEENKFILDCFNHSASIFYVDCVACYHTTLLSNRNIDYMNSMQAKGYLLSFVPHWLAIVLFIRWGVRFSKISELSLFMCFRLLLQGYFIRQKAR
ncbi:MAG TPA: hypothetical protein DDZ61_12345 [Aeromonas salmonicida]|nr:hypothetical protein [Aeromonas salmonicida]